jgi:uncharacterized membrane-anchored protein YhcB (DUF1043 family)
VAAAWFSFLIGIVAGVVLLAVILHFVDKAMRY